MAAEAVKTYQQAVKLDPVGLSARMGIAKIEENRKNYGEALAQLNEVVRLDVAHAAARYLRGQVLVRMGREKEGRLELKTATKLLNDQRSARGKELEGEKAPSPELEREPQ